MRAAHPDRLRGDVGEHLQVLDPHRRPGLERHPPDDAVPVALRVVADAVRVHADVDDERVVHADREHVHAGREAAEVVLVRRREAVVAADDLAVHRDERLPVRPLEREDRPPPGPVPRDLDVGLVPGRVPRSRCPAAARTAP